MIVYHHGSPGKTPVQDHTFILCPGGHLSEEECPSAFWEGKGERRAPKTFQVRFVYGKAEVDDELGKYMVSQKLAEKSRLILPNTWDH